MSSEKPTTPESVPSTPVDPKIRTRKHKWNNLKAKLLGCFNGQASAPSLEKTSPSTPTSGSDGPNSPLSNHTGTPGFSASEVQRYDSINTQSNNLTQDPQGDGQRNGDEANQKEEKDQFKAILDNYKLSRRPIGTGTFAVVYKGVGKADGIDYALKFINKKVLEDLGQSQLLVEREIEVLRSIQHDNVISLYEIFETRDAIVLVTDFAHGGELMGRFYDVPSFTEHEAVNLMRQLLEGVAYLHEQGIVHRDIKPENLLLREATEQLGDAHLLIADFGLARALKANTEPLVTACGTPQYVAPEILTGDGYSTPVDLWSCGVVMYFLLCGYVPYQGGDQASLLDSIQTAELYFLEEDWSDVSPLGCDLIRKLLDRDPTGRPTAAEALQHPWFQLPAPASIGDLPAPETANLQPKLLRNRDTQKMLRNAMARLRAVNQFNSLLVHHFRDFSLDDHTPIDISEAEGGGDSPVLTDSPTLASPAP